MGKSTENLIIEYVDARGELSILEGSLLPFEIKRVYWIKNVPNEVIRGNHAHKELEQYLFCIKGEIILRISDGINTTEFTLRENESGKYLPPGLWRTMEFTYGSILMVLASASYSEDDYIRDWDEFIKWKEKVYE
jgi:dTDP-4-dehydrorhamnose 3,5-epimerase-like enzyme